MAVGKRRATYEDLCKIPDTIVAEIIDGELIATLRSASPNARATTVLAGELGGFNRPPGDPDGPGDWWILFEPELHFRDDVLVPDVAGWRHARMPVLETVAAFTMPASAHGGTDAVRAEPFDAIELQLARWWIDG